MDEPIPFNRPGLTGAELANISEAVENRYLSGNGPFTRRCAEDLERRLACRRVLLTPSGTAALELGALLLGLGPGDEVIMPSFTFPTTASSVVLRGATPVFVDIRDDTLNLDERLLESALSERTRAILPVHYAGVGCEMEAIMAFAEEHGLAVLEDAAHAIGATWGGRALGTFGALGTLSFHETKNITCGEGGALLINDEDLIDRAEILQEKGTNRSAFFRGEVDKYTWVEIGSSFVISDLSAAFLLAQLENLEQINGQRVAIWERYRESFASLADEGLLRLPHVPEPAGQNGHMFYVRLGPGIDRDKVISTAKRNGVHTVFHYVPLHSAPAGHERGRAVGGLPVTERAGAELIRLPLWTGMEDELIDRVVETVTAAVREAARDRVAS